MNGEYLFLGGPRHGEVHRVNTEHINWNILHIPHFNKSKITAIDEKISPLEELSVQAISYKLVTFANSKGNIRKAFVVELGDPNKLLFEYLCSEWIDQSPENEFFWKPNHNWSSIHSNSDWDLTPSQIEDLKKQLAEVQSKKAHKVPHNELEKLQTLIPGLNRTPPATHEFCPECKERSKTIGTMIVHLNDKHRWDFERIADHLETMPLHLLEVKNAATPK